MIELSMNEVETLSTKAARGSGFSWGLAEDIGKAARSLAAAELPWQEALLALLAYEGTRASPIILARSDTSQIVSASGSDGPLCPVRTGAWLLDSGILQGEDSLEIEGLALPIWLAASLVAAGSGRTMMLSWKGAEMRIAGNRLLGIGDELLASSANAALVPCEVQIDQGTPKGRAWIDKSILAALDTIAAKTYVPSSESSRAKGAGGSRTDNE